MFKDSSLDPRLINIRNKIWGKHLPPISEATGVPVAILSMVQRNKRKRLTIEQYEKLEAYINKEGL